MKNIFLTLFAIVFSMCSLNAQEVVLEWGEEEPKSGYLVGMLPFHSKDFYSLRWKGGSFLGGFYLSRHDDFKITNTDKVTKSVNNSIADFESAAIVGDHPVVFLSDFKENVHQLFLQEYGYDLKPKGQPNMLVEFALEKGQSRNSFSIIQSKNKKYFAVFWSVSGKRKDKNLYGYKVFNEMLEVMNEGEYELPFEAQYSEITTQLLSDSGQFFIAVKEFEPTGERKLFRAFLQYKALHIYQIMDGELDDYVLDLRGNRVEAISINSNESNQFIISGVYGKNQIEGVSGLFYLKLNYQNKEVIQEGFEEFKKDFITEDWSENELESAERREEKGKGAPSLYDYKMRDVYMLEDGSIVGSLEQHYVMVRSYSDARGITTTTLTYYFNDIIAFKIGTSGEFEWLKKIKKMQVSTNDEGPYSSYASYCDGQSLKFIFNDSRANYSENGTYIPDYSYMARFSKRDNVVSIAEVHLATGEYKRRSLFSRKEIGTLALPKMFETDHLNKEMLIYTTFRSKERYGLLKF